jgi:phosphatidylglycerophosphatase C
MKDVIAAFDFDGTITTKDSLLPFFFFTHGIFYSLIQLSLEMPAFIQFLAGNLNRQGIKEKLLTRFYEGESYQSLMERGEQFAFKHLPKLVKKEALKRIQWHKNQKHRLLLISANLDVYLSPWAKNYGFETALCSQLAYTDQKRFTGQLLGKNCRAEEKVRRLLAYAGPKDGFELYAYGDSDGDKQLLSIADYPYYRLF